MPTYEWPVKFDSGYDCSIAGYEEAARKLKEIGPEDVNKHRISITFSCAGIQETWQLSYISSIILNSPQKPITLFPLVIGFIFSF